MSETSPAAAQSTSNALLSIRDLCVDGLSGETWRRLVNGVSLELKRGEVLGLIGESGAGKSTLGLAAMGFIRDGCRFAGGSVVFDGLELTKAPRPQRRALRS